ncbi:hypothetical protein [Amycolatopsis thermoflava]|uniref:hypothetical protein n=1 Tax=Amycolatopsis thermoflava TaxID=84480 RepID=UPI000400A01A|nr:hypothetical protein [Amycolatopsis thermoflava]
MFNSKKVSGFLAALAALASLIVMTPSAAAADKLHAEYLYCPGGGIGCTDWRLYFDVSVDRVDSDTVRFSGVWEPRLCNGTVGGNGQIRIYWKTSEPERQYRNLQECTDKNRELTRHVTLQPGGYIEFQVCGWGGFIPSEGCGNWVRSERL